MGEDRSASVDAPKALQDDRPGVWMLLSKRRRLHSATAVPLRVVSGRVFLLLFPSIVPWQPCIFDVHFVPARCKVAVRRLSNYATSCRVRERLQCSSFQDYLHVVSVVFPGYRTEMLTWGDAEL